MRTTQQTVGSKEPNSTGSGSKPGKTATLIKKKGSQFSRSVSVDSDSIAGGGSSEHREFSAGEDRNAQIAMRAYELYRQRGGCHGEDQADWFEAERQILSTA